MVGRRSDIVLEVGLDFICDEWNGFTCLVFNPIFGTFTRHQKDFDPPIIPLFI